MNLYEYQGREILKSFSIHVPNGIMVKTPEQAVQAAKILFKKTNKKSLVIKAQIHAGGRGKSGGIKIVNTLDNVYKESKNILGKFLSTHQTSQKGIQVQKILLSEDVYSLEPNPPVELYLSILLNREIEKNIILYSKKGGVNIEELSKKKPYEIYKEEIDPLLGLQYFQIRKIAFHLGIKHKDSLKNFIKFLMNLYNAYQYYDALLIEINPLIQTFNNNIIPIDVKITLDDNALFRHNISKKKYNLFNKVIKSKLNFVKLTGGNVGCMVNGAGLAMATMDMIKSCGGNPSNFLDIGGNADRKRVEKAFSIIIKDKSVKIVLVNIFGGIVRCDIVAKGIIDSYSKKNPNYVHKIPLIIRLQGTNEKIARSILQNYLLSTYYVSSLKEASDKIKKILLKK